MHTNLRLGLSALDEMRAGGDAVGPVLCCPEHQAVLIPVEEGTADRWLAPHSQCLRAGWQCRPVCGSTVRRCAGRVWLLPDICPQRMVPASSQELHHRLCVSRARWASAA
ncbi:hypothetical protein GCM10010394_47540 [Streptomyces crystallinus]|uniref:Uncharacterized protein n=1 Tax=Streptomyces crystallinus TaxID=68191 RepID=A0ABN1GII1_9ACTN